MFGRDLIGKFISKFSNVPEFYKWFRKVKVNFDSFILDVGCDNGNLLLILRKKGFNNLTGIDPYIHIQNDIIYGNGVKVLKRDLKDMKQEFDFIMLNHSFEHIAGSVSVLTELNRLLKHDQYLIIRTPVVPCYAFRKYGVNWVQIDTPKHKLVYSKRGIELLTSEVGFQLVNTVYDSKALQFWGSEQYLKGIYLMDRNSCSQNLRKFIFSEKEIHIFERKAAELNRKGEGDQAVFYFYKKAI